MGQDLTEHMGVPRRGWGGGEGASLPFCRPRNRRGQVQKIGLVKKRKGSYTLTGLFVTFSRTLLQSACVVSKKILDYGSEGCLQQGSNECHVRIYQAYQGIAEPLLSSIYTLREDMLCMLS